MPGAHEPKETVSGPSPEGAGSEALRAMLGVRSPEPGDLETAACPAPLPPGQPFPSSTDKLGRYPVVEELGRGGMSAVYLVRDEELDRPVAAKVLRAHPAFLRPDQLVRFHAEARITGQLEHPNIPPVHEMGRSADGRPYFTMKRIEGESLAAILAGEKARELEGRPAELSLAELLQTFLKICDGVAFAHSRGVMHRDLKPANIMVGRFGEVLVVDWGLAKIRGQGEEGRGQEEEKQQQEAGVAGDPGSHPFKTEMGSVMGTPVYMSPEQAEGRSDEIDERSDIYSLGAMLYELLSLEPPFTGKTVEEVISKVLTEDLVPPSRRAPGRNIPWELDAVVQRAMEPRKKDRYGSVEELRADVARFLGGHPLEAATYRVWHLLAKWASRHRPAVTAGGVAAAVVLASVAAAFVQIAGARDREAQERRKAEDALSASQTALEREKRALAGEAERRAEAESALADALVFKGDVALSEGRLLDAGVFFWGAARRAESARTYAARFALPRPFLVLSGTLRGHEGLVVAVAGSREGDLVATASLDGTAGVWDARTGERRLALPSGRGPVTAVALSPAGDLLATGAAGELRLWRLPDGNLAAAHETPGDVTALAFSPDGSLLAAGLAGSNETGSGESPRAFLWDVARQELARTLPVPRDVFAVAFSPDGRRLATGGALPSEIWDVASGEKVRSLAGHDLYVTSVAFSPDGKLVATGSADRSVRLWDAVDGAFVRAIRCAANATKSLAFSAEGRLLAFENGDGTVLLHSLEEEAPLQLVRAHDGEIPSIDFLTENPRLLTAGADGAVRIWSLDLQGGERAFPGDSSALQGLAWAPDGGSLATASRDGTVELREAPSGRVLARWTDGQKDAAAVAFSPDGRLLAAASDGNSIRFRLVPDGSVLASVAVPPTAAIEFSPDGRWLAVASFDRSVRLVRLDGFAVSRALEEMPDWPTSVSFHPDSNLLAAGCMDGLVRLWELESADPAPVRAWRAHAGGVRGVRFLAGGSVLATCGQDGNAALWDPASGARSTALRGHHNWAVFSLAGSPDGRLVATASESIWLWDAATGARLRALSTAGHAGFGPVAFSPDGRLLAAGDQAGTLHLWGADAPASLAEAEKRAGCSLRGLDLVLDSGRPEAGGPEGPPLEGSSRGNSR
ncbi:MAG: protein kinase [Planctomycetes bacterium]|nr:protein kinase [Planctomycetota bacterium]